MSKTDNQIKIELDIESYNKIVRAMNQITGRSAEAIMAGSANKILKTVQKRLTKKENEVYVGEHPKGTKDRSSLEKAKVSAGIANASVNFQSRLRGISKFYASKRQTPTKWQKGHDINIPVARVGGKLVYRRVKRKRNSFNLNVGQLKGQRKTITKAFRMLIHNTKKDGTAGGDHQFIGYRDKENKYKVHQVLGSSDMVLIRNEKVYGKEEAELGKMYLDECMRRLDAALAKVR